MTDLSTSDLKNFWEGFQKEFDDWYYAPNGYYTDIFYCATDLIERFCRPNFYQDHFSSEECETYCVNDNYCSLYWTKQAKICCEKTCDQRCTSMGESVRGECSSTTTTSMTTTTTTTKNPVTTSTFPTTNETSYTKQPFGKSPLISVPIVAGLLFLFIVVYLLRRRFKSPLNMSTGDRSNDSVFFDQMIQFFSSVYEAEIRPTAPSTDDDNSFTDNETNKQIIPSLETQPEPNAPSTDAPPSYDDCVSISPPKTLSQPVFQQFITVECKNKQ